MQAPTQFDSKTKPENESYNQNVLIFWGEKEDEARAGDPERHGITAARNVDIISCMCDLMAQAHRKNKKQYQKLAHERLFILGLRDGSSIGQTSTFQARARCTYAKMRSFVHQFA